MSTLQSRLKLQTETAPLSVAIWAIWAWARARSRHGSRSICFQPLLVSALLLSFISLLDPVLERTKGLISLSKPKCSSLNSRVLIVMFVFLSNRFYELTISQSIKELETPNFLCRLPHIVSISFLVSNFSTLFSNSENKNKKQYLYYFFLVCIVYTQDTGSLTPEYARL